MPVTYGGAVDADNPAVVDTNASQGTGAACTGIGLTGADAASLGAARIGGAPGTDLKFETGDGVGV